MHWNHCAPFLARVHLDLESYCCGSGLVKGVLRVHVMRASILLIRSIRLTAG